MDISGIQNSLKVDLLVKSPQAVVDAWKVGQLVNATVVNAPKNGQVSINVGGALLLAQTPFPVTPGQPLKLEVSSLAASTVLTLINSTNNAGKPIAVPSITVSLPAQPSLIKQLSIGQPLAARLLPSTGNQPTRALLELAGQRVAVQLSQSLPANIGQQLKLDVVSPGAIAALKILTPPVSATDNIPLALRATLPRQAPLPPLLANLALIARESSRSILPNGPRLIPPLPQTVVDLTRSIVDRLPNPQSMSTADGVKQAVAQSGLFLEARLAQTLQQPAQPQSAVPLTANIPIDFKGGLLSLLVSLLSLVKATPSTLVPPTNTQTPNPLPLASHNPTTVQATLNQSMNLQQALTELLRSVETGVARLQLNQLVSSAPEEEGKRSWVMELPTRNGEHIDLIQLCIEKEKQQHEKKKTVLWTVTLSLSPKGLGSIQARVSLANNIINTRFWSKNPLVTAFIQENLPILKNRYREVGLTIGTLKSHEGQAPTPTSADEYLHHTLLDENA